MKMTLKIEVPDLEKTEYAVEILASVNEAIKNVMRNEEDYKKVPQWTYSFEDEPIEIEVSESTPLSRYLSNTTKSGSSHKE